MKASKKHHFLVLFTNRSYLQTWIAFKLEFAVSVNVNIYPRELLNKQKNK